MPSPIRLAVLLQDLEFGGTQRYAIHLLNHLDRSLFTPELWVLRGGMDLADQARATGVEISWLSKSRRVTPVPLARLLTRLKKSPPEVLYTLTVVPNIWGRVMAGLTGFRPVVTGYRNLIPKQHDRWLWPLSSRIICNAEILKETAASRFKVDPARLAVVPNAVDHEWFQPRPGEKAQEPTAVYIGRLVAEKGADVVTAAFIEAARLVPAARFEIIGDGPLRDRLTAAVKEAGLEERIAIRPGLPDVRPILNRAWVFVMGSRREGSPNVILEAMASGLPIAATRVGGIPELVDDGVTGRLVPPENPGALAEAAAGLLRDESLARGLGRAAREKAVKNYSPAEMARRTEKVLLEAFEEAGGRRA